ncbi:MAG: hypothetical protein VKN13_05350 [Cyanobacteriota bacterium]|nr:hypothetical protein [Cyanobacteriota bacterium]
MQIYAPAADPSLVETTAASLGIPVVCLAPGAELLADRLVLLIFQPLDLRLAEGRLPQATEQICHAYHHLLRCAADPAALAGQRRLVINLSTCSLPTLLQQAHACGSTWPAGAAAFTRPQADPLAALVALRLDQQWPGTLAACERLDQLAGAPPQALSYRQQLEQACGAEPLMVGWRRRHRLELQLQEQGQELELRTQELGGLPDQVERLQRQLEGQSQALARSTEMETERNRWQQRCRELDLTLNSVQQQLEQQARLAEQRAELIACWARTSQGLQRLQPRWYSSP